MKNIIFSLFLSCCCFNLNSLASRIADDVLSDAIQDVSEGRKDFCFIPVTYSDIEASFLNNLRVALPENIGFAKSLSINGRIAFLAEEKESQSSRFKQANTALIKFFHDNTNAHELGEKFDLNGPEFLARIMLEHAEQIVKSKKTNKMSIIVRAFRENDYLLNYPRWHYDGYISNTRKSDLTFAGALVGAPTIFANIRDDNKRNQVQQKLIERNHAYKSFDSYTAEEQLTKLRVHRDRYQEDQTEYKNLAQEINSFNALYNTSDAVRTGELLRRHDDRREFSEFLEENNVIESITHAQPFEISVFNMYGTSPALHSEPHIAVPRIFFSIQSQETPPYNNIDDFDISDDSVDPERLF